MSTPESPEDRTTEDASPAPSTGVATGLGSLPGLDPREAARAVVGELPDLPHVPELPDRGVGADMLGRGVALLVDIAAEVRPSGWRVASRPGGDHRRAVGLLARDVDALDETLGETGAAPPRVKAQVVGPWTLAAGVELRSGHRALTDRGAVAEFAASLAEGLSAHVAEVGRRTAPVVVQIDEPGLPAALEGSLSTPSGYGIVSAVPGAEARARLADLVEAARAAGAAEVVVHCCHPRPPLALLGAVGADAVAVDLLELGRGHGAERSPTAGGGADIPAAVLDALGELWDTTTLWTGLVPTSRPDVPPTLHDLARPALELADRLGYPRTRLSERAVVTPACGLAGADPAWARRALGFCTELASAFPDPPTSG